MDIAFDRAKSARNARERGLPFTRAADFEWETAVYREDTRRAYPERRFIATGLLDGRVHVICYARIAGGVRIISFRKANPREVRAHGQESEQHGED